MTNPRPLLLLLMSLMISPLLAVDNELCLECHADANLTTERGGKTVTLFVRDDEYQKSVHGDMDCVGCHVDADVEELPHAEQLEPVNCGSCHDQVQLDFDASIHGMALNRKAIYAPNCAECHGKHDIKAKDDPTSPTYKMRIPYLCGKCHREGAPVARVYQIGEHNIIENYSQSIHGEGLFKKGLTVTATCNDCHRSHMILPHTYANSSVSMRNIATTCMQCHSRIEEVHTQIIRGELWEQAPGAIPACSDCHLPHEVRRESITINLSDRACMKCHEQRDIHKMANGEKISLLVTKEELSDSEHRNIPCVKCHADVDPNLKRPCEPAGKVDCSNCHAKVSEEYYVSGHGQAYVRGDEDAPYCIDCHGDHRVQSHLDDSSPTFRSAIPQMCGECHKEGTHATQTHALSQVNALTDYSTSVHGRGLVEKGLLPSAICIDCHNSHMILSHKDERSSVSRNNIPATCSGCHRGIFKDFITSVHFSTDKKKKEKQPTCSDCHSSHTISSVSQDKFVFQVTDQCGSCHKDLADTYFETTHGKAYMLGYTLAAKCSDCHGAHDIMALDAPESHVGMQHIVETCQKCHANANERFTGYLTHATHHDPDKYPILFYTYWFMTSLLIGVFGFFGLHTLLWLPRSIKHMRIRRRHAKEDPEQEYVQRFTTTQRVTHIFVITSFILLALTGMMLKFSNMAWASFLADIFGGVKNAGLLHRLAAIVTFGYFGHHLYTLIKEKRSRKTSWIKFIFNRESLMFNLQDLKDFGATMKWFTGFGPKPGYGRWTYWEKFDYFAVFWGVAVIGFSGLIKWFPEYFTIILPGWLINVAAIVHSDEALLAVGFIFTIHFFNTHLRPEAFPMDRVIFTGVMPLDELKNDRPREYQQLVGSGELEKRIIKPAISETRSKIIAIFGYSALIIGIIMIGLIIYSVLFGYN